MIEISTSDCEALKYVIDRGRVRRLTFDPDSELDRGCPNCASTDEPELVVYGSGLTGQGWVLRCRAAIRDWSDCGSVQSFSYERYVLPQSFTCVEIGSPGSAKKSRQSFLY